MFWVVPPHPANAGPMFEFGWVLCSFGFCEDSVKLLQFAHLKIRLSHSWEGGLAWLGKDSSWMHSHWDQKYPWSHVVHSIRSFYEPLIWPFRPITPFACTAWASGFQGLAKLCGNCPVCYWHYRKQNMKLCPSALPCDCQHCSATNTQNNQKLHRPRSEINTAT